MMRDTPRTFVGTVALTLGDGVSDRALDGLREHPELVAGVRVADVDPATRTLVVSARRPADRGEVVAALARLGCPVRT